MITITLDGGIIQSVSTDTESEKNLVVVVLDSGCEASLYLEAMDGQLTHLCTGRILETLTPASRSS